MSAATNILIVDDHSPTRKLIRLGLQRLGYAQFHEAGDGQEAIDMIPGLDVNLILTDLEMEGLDGLELLRYVRSNYGDLPVVVLSSHHEAEFRDAAADLGASDFLSKPLNLGELKAVMGRILS